MSNAIDQAVANQIKNIEKATGKTVAEWAGIINSSGLQKHGELVTMLKTTYGLGHGNANTLVHAARQSSASTQAAETDLLGEQYAGKENLKVWYDWLATEIKKFGTDIEFSPKKAYMSLRRKKQFALIQPSIKTRLDVGLNLKGVEPGGALEASGSWNAMCTHRIKIEDKSALNSNLVNWLKQAYDQAG